MNRVNFKNINTKSVDQSYFKPKINVKVKKEIKEEFEDKPKYRNFDFEDKIKNWMQYDDYIGNGIYQQIRQRTKYTPVKIPEEMKPTEDFTWEIQGNNNNLGENINDLEVVTKVEKSKEEITKTFISNDNRKYDDRGYHGWHGHCKYKLGTTSITITDNVGGCGVQQLYGWGSSGNSSKIPKILDYILEDLNHGVGIILCQVGSDYYNTLFCQTIEKLGFKYHEEYINYQHAGRDTGRIYTLIIDKNEKNKGVTETK